MSLPPRVLGIDYGTKRIGVAVSDPLGVMAHPLATLQAGDEAALLAGLRELIDEKDAKRIVVGVPVNMDGTEGPSAKAARALAANLEQLGLPVETIDERLTTRDADERLAAAGHRHWKKRKQRVDQAAAALILESWMQREAARRRRRPPP